MHGQLYAIAALCISCLIHDDEFMLGLLSAAFHGLLLQLIFAHKLNFISCLGCLIYACTVDSCFMQANRIMHDILLVYCVGL